MSCIVIAEAGVNHNGDVEIAKDLICAAKDAGADFIKFQTFITEKSVSVRANKADYQIKSTGKNESQYDMVKKLELSFDDFQILKEYCEKHHIGFLSTPFDFDSIDFLKKLSIDYWKIPSGEITNLPYLRKIGSYNSQIILSTGMSTLSEVKRTLGILTKSGTEKEKITVLHCNTEYPTPYEDVNLNAMITLKNELKVSVGYSDHTLGIQVPIAAVAIGAQIIEKHLTLDRNMTGPDHCASIEPHVFSEMVESIRIVEKCLGSFRKEPTLSELKNLTVARKSIVAARDISIGEEFSERNLAIKRPGTGVSPMNWELYLGKRSLKSYRQDDLIDE